MALQVELEVPSNIIADAASDQLPPTLYSQAYARIQQIRVDRSLSVILVCWYTNAAACLNGDAPLKMYEYGTPTAELTGDIYPAAYNYLKTLPDFAGAIDC